MSPSGAVRSASLVLIPLLPFGFLRHQNCFSPSCFLPGVAHHFTVARPSFTFHASVILFAYVALSLSIIQMNFPFLVSTLSGRSKVRHPPDGVTCNHPASSDSTFVSLLVVPSQQFFRAMSSLFFRCKFSASGVRQVPLCSTIGFTTLFLYKFHGSLPHFLLYAK